MRVFPALGIGLDVIAAEAAGSLYYVLSSHHHLLPRIFTWRIANKPSMISEGFDKLVALAVFTVPVELTDLSSLNKWQFRVDFKNVAQNGS
jgi:hypothetical protein